MTSLMTSSFVWRQIMYQFLCSATLILTLRSFWAIDKSAGFSTTLTLTVTLTLILTLNTSFYCR